jgi:hypothetical protein
MYFINPTRNARFWHENVFYRVREEGHFGPNILCLCPTPRSNPSAEYARLPNAALKIDRTPIDPFTNLFLQ